MWRTNFTRLIQTYGSSAIPRPLSHRASAQNGFGSALDVSAEVRQALEGGKPVVALESTIITHGMPWPSNFETAIAVENVVREQGAIPATIAILSGRIKVGLLPDELELLAKPKDSSVKPPPIKVSRRDIPYALANNLDGGTTVAGTMIAAHMAGIPIFATGGIGGVHRGGEDSMDISADLVELGRTPVSVICAGVKSILDIERTLEYLETQGVPVAVLAECNFFPAFYACSHAGLKAPQHVTTVLQAAKLIAMSRKAQLSNGSLIAVPVPEELAMDEKQVDEAIATALKKASNAHVRGKEVTPFLLQAIKEITHGRSLETNIALVKNNAKTGAQIALELIKLENCERTSDINNEVKKCQEKMIYHDQKRYHHTLTPVVVGGSNADIYIKVTDPDIKLDGSTLSCSSSAVSGGGVGRNIAEAMYKLGAMPKLISAVGKDAHGRFLDSLLPEECTRTVHRPIEGGTASCTVILDHTGECKLFLGDMKMHDNITVDLIKRHEKVFENAQLVVLDSNIPLSTMKYVIKTAHRFGKPVFYEPTDMRKASRILEFSLPEPLAFCTPNMAELRAMAAAIMGNSLVENVADKNLLAELKSLCSTLIFENIVDVLVVTLGDKGVAIARLCDNSERLFDDSGVYIKPGHKTDKKISVRLYPPAQLPANSLLANTSGAGDCFAAGFAVAAMLGVTLNGAVAAGNTTAIRALLSNIPVPDKLFLLTKQNWTSEATYKEL